MGSRIAKMMLPPLLLLLLHTVLSVADGNKPTFAIPFPLSDWRHKAYSDIMRQGFEDAIILARVVVLTGSDCDDSFLRYFQKQDFDFVQAMFGQIAGIDPPDNNDPANAAAILADDTLATSLSEKWNDLIISLGDNPIIPPKIIQLLCAKDPVNAIMYYDHQAPRTGWAWQGGCYMAMCPNTPLFWFRLDLASTENPPSFARDSAGQPKEGWSCDKLGNHDNGYMKVVGLTVLHELFHCPDLFASSVPKYNDVIYDGLQYGKKYSWHQIRDTPLDNPSYGPWRAANLNKLDPDPKTGMSMSIQNADNYAWYALSKYWAWKCNKKFGPAISDADNGSEENRGPVPAPAPPPQPAGAPPPLPAPAVPNPLPTPPPPYGDDPGENELNDGDPPAA